MGWRARCARHAADLTRVYSFQSNAHNHGSSTMTERLYYTDSFLQTFEARVLDVRS